MINHLEVGLICDVITPVKLLHTNCYHAKICSADIYFVENHNNNNLYLFMVPITPCSWSWLMDYICSKSWGLMLTFGKFGRDASQEF